MKSHLVHETALRHIHSFLCAAIAPRPVVLVSTLDEEGNRNLAPFSSIMPITGKPPLLVLSFNRHRGGIMKRTTKNILGTREFVVNVVEADQLPTAIELALRQPKGRTEKWPTTLPAEASTLIHVPRVSACRAAIECQFQSHQVLGEDGFISDLIIAKIVAFWQPEEGTASLRPIGALDMDWYTDSERRIHCPFPSP